MHTSITHPTRPPRIATRGKRIRSYLRLLIEGAVAVVLAVPLGPAMQPTLTVLPEPASTLVALATASALFAVVYVISGLVVRR